MNILYKKKSKLWLSQDNHLENYFKRFYLNNVKSIISKYNLKSDGEDK